MDEKEMGNLAEDLGSHFKAETGWRPGIGIWIGETVRRLFSLEEKAETDRKARGEMRATIKMMEGKIAVLEAREAALAAIEASKLAKKAKKLNPVPQEEPEAPKDK